MQSRVFYSLNDVSKSDWLSHQVGSVVNGYHPVGYVARVTDWLSSLEYDSDELLVLPGVLVDVVYDCELFLYV